MDASRTTKIARLSILMTMIMVFSTLLNPAVAQSSQFEFSTRGEILLLDSENQMIISIDHEDLLKTGDIDYATQSTTSLVNAYHAKPTSLTHDYNHLIIGYDDGWIQVYSKEDGQTPFTHWTSYNAFSLPTNHIATSLTLHSGNLYWTSNNDAIIRSTPISTLDNTPTSWVTDTSLVNSTSLAP